MQGCVCPAFLDDLGDPPTGDHPRPRQSDVHVSREAEGLIRIELLGPDGIPVGVLRMPNARAVELATALLKVAAG